MTQEVKRNYLEISSLKDLKEIKEISKLDLINKTTDNFNRLFFQ